MSRPDPTARPDLEAAEQLLIRAVEALPRGPMRDAARQAANDAGRALTLLDAAEGWESSLLDPAEVGRC